MKLVSTVSVLVMLAAAPVLAESGITAEKKAPTFNTLIKPTGANVQYRHYYNMKAAGDELTATEPAGQVRTNLTFGLFDDFMSTTAIFAATKTPNKQELSMRTIQLWNAVTVFKGDVVSVDAFADVRLPNGGNGTAAYLGFQPTANATLAETTIGKFDFAFDSYFYAGTGSRAEDAKYKDGAQAYARDRGFSLAADSETDVAGQKEDVTYEVDTETLIKYTPSGASKLTVGVGLAYERFWDPAYTYNETSKTTDMSYTAVDATRERLQISYKATEKLSISNDSYINHNGTWESRVNGDDKVASFMGRFYNYTKLSYTLY